MVLVVAFSTLDVYNSSRQSSFLFQVKILILFVGIFGQFFFERSFVHFLVSVKLTGIFFVTKLPLRRKERELEFKIHPKSNIATLGGFRLIEFAFQAGILSLMDWNGMERKRVSLLNGFLTLFYLPIDLVML